MGLTHHKRQRLFSQDDEVERDRSIRRMRSRCPRQCHTVRNMRVTAKQRDCDREEKRRMTAHLSF